MKCCSILLLLLLTLFCKVTDARSVKDFNVTNFTNGNGLPQSSVKAAEIDKDGYLWIATESGLVRFDGKSFRIFNRNTLPLLSSDRISHVGLLPGGNIYLVDEHSRIYTRNQEQGFSVYPLKANQDLVINSCGGLYNPRLQLGIDGYNFIKSRYIEKWTNNLTFFPTTDSLSGFITVNKRSIAYVSHRKAYWIRHHTNSNSHVLHAYGIQNGILYFLDDRFRVNYLDSIGNSGQAMITGLLPQKKRPGAAPADYSLLQHRRDLYLLYDKKIYRLTASAPGMLTAQLVIDAEGMEHISTICYFPEHSLYVVGTNTQGIYLLRPKPFQVLRTDGADNVFYAQAPLGDSGVLTHSAVLREGHPPVLFPEKMFKLSILKDKNGGYWVNKAGESLQLVDGQLKASKVFPVPDLYINCMAQTPDGDLWFITNKNRIGHVKGNEIDWINLDLPANSLVSLLPVDNETFWISGSHLLFRLNTRTGIMERYRAFDDTDVRSLYLDSGNRLWIGTYGKGLFALTGKTLTRLPMDNKKNLRYVHGLIEDGTGNVWITTNNGLFRTRKSDLDNFAGNGSGTVYYQRYTKDQGFLTNEFNGGCNPAAIQLPCGKLSFPSMNGIVQFHPSALQDQYPLSDIFIDELRVDEKVISAHTAPELPASFNRMEVEVSSPYYGEPDNQVIEYRLAGFDNKWYPLDDNNAIVFHRLPPGNYVLHLRKNTGRSLHQYIEYRLPFRVVPFFYQQWYFKLLLFFLCVVLVAVLFRVRYYILIRRQYSLEQKVQQRTRELVHNNRLREKLTLLIAHDLQSPLHFLSILAQHVHKAAQKNDLPGVMEGSEEIRSTTLKIYAFVEEFNLWSKALHDSYRLKQEQFPAGGLVSDLEQFFEEMVRMKKNQLVTSFPEGLLINSDRDVLKAILRNLIDNANKYTYNGRINVAIGVAANGRLFVTVSDDGQGMDEAALAQLRARIGRKATPVEKDSRLGFQLIIDFAALLGGGLSVDSARGAGTTVVLSGIDCSYQPVTPIR